MTDSLPADQYAARSGRDNRADILAVVAYDTVSPDSMSTLKKLHAVTGRCACGRVTYACSVEDETALCSCDLCRRNSGSAFQAWVNGARTSLTLSGDPPAAWASTDHATRHFCASCGSTLFLFEHDEPEVVEVAAGTIDTPDGITSTRRSVVYAAGCPRWGWLGEIDANAS